jgi:rhamnosyltransferase subunit B
MHILIIAIGYGSDVYPLIGLGRTIAREDHRVSVCTHPIFSEAVERAGLRMLPLGTAEEYQELLTGPEQAGGAMPFDVHAGMMARYMRPMIALLLRQISKDTVLVGSPWAFGARMMQEKYGVPYVSVQLSPATILSVQAQTARKSITAPLWFPATLREGFARTAERNVLDSICGPELNAVREEIGLPRLKNIASWVHSSAAELGLFPDWFAPTDAEWPRQMKLTGFPLYDSAEAWKKDDELEKFLQGKPAPVVFAPGHAQVQGPDYFEAASECLHQMGERGIFLAKSTDMMPSLGQNILVRSYLPLSRLLPRAKALVHPGGTGGVSQALAAGTPQLVVPATYDQIDNAIQVERLGCGLRMDTPMTASKLLPMLTQLLNDGGLRAACEVRRHRVQAGERSRRNALAVIEAVGKSAPEITLPVSDPVSAPFTPDCLPTLTSVRN